MYHAIAGRSSQLPPYAGTISTGRTPHKRTTLALDELREELPGLRLRDETTSRESGRLSRELIDNQLPLGPAPGCTGEARNGVTCPWRFSPVACQLFPLARALWLLGDGQEPTSAGATTAVLGFK